MAVGWVEGLVHIQGSAAVADSVAAEAVVQGHSRDSEQGRSLVV